MILINIGIDARTLIKNKTGLGFYLEGILIELINKDTINNYYLFSDRKIYFDSLSKKNVFLIEDNSNILLKKTPWYMFKLPQIIKKYNINLFWGTQHILPFNLDIKVKKLLTIHDFVYYKFPNTTTLYNKILCKLLVPYSIKSADFVITDSISTKQDLISYFPKFKNKLEVIYLGANIKPINERQEDDFFNKYDEINKNKYLFYVGTIEPRKNLNILLSSFDEIYEKTNLQLVIAGKMGWKYKEFLNLYENSKYKDKIVYLNYVTEVEKNILMKNCFLFVFPSIYEGFGLPVVEAMKNNAVVLNSNASSLDEINELEELKFNPYNSEEIIRKISYLYYNKDFYKKMKEYCLQRGAYFNWNISADRCLQIFDELNEFDKSEGEL